MIGKREQWAERIGTKVQDIMEMFLLKVNQVINMVEQENLEILQRTKQLLHQRHHLSRKQFDPETTKYFTKIANVIEGSEIDLEERSIICGCSVDHLCAFLRSCRDKFSHISMDSSGSHVAKTALKSLARHLQDDDNHSLIEDTLSALFQAIVVNPVDVMCNCYGSHVLRRILCLCKGVPIESSESHNVKSSVALAEHLNMRSSQLDAHEIQNQSFSDQLKLLMSEMLNPLRVILAVAPDNLYNDVFTKVFKNSLFRMSSDPSANFVVQALISHARSQEHLRAFFTYIFRRFIKLENNELTVSRGYWYGFYWFESVAVEKTQVDPETTKYVTEIANVIEGTEIDLEERCGNALEEARGKEVELATDYIISHTMQTLLEGCSVDHLCAFLRSCREKFCHISMDRSGSHVAATTLKSLTRNLQDDDNHSPIEDTISSLCQAIVVSPVDVMCNYYGSHVLRRILCLCKGVPIESSESHNLKSSVALAERLNMRSSQLDAHEKQNQPFPDQLKLLISEMLNLLRVDIATLLTSLKLLVGQEQELPRLIPLLLGFRLDKALEENFMEVKAVKKFLRLVEDNAYSLLMEVILAVAPDNLYNEIFTKVFKNSLFRMSLDPSANFVVQALISHKRSQEHLLGRCPGDIGMVSIGLRALPLRKHRSRNLYEDSLMVEKCKSSYDRKTRTMGRKDRKKSTGHHGDASTESQSGDKHGGTGKPRNFAKDKTASSSEASFVRKQVGPETTKYFTEIANVIEGTEIDLEERSIICGNALEEARGKEVELATDYIISHTMQTLLEGCSVDHLCAFLRSCREKFSHISMDRSGSHVAETALKSLARHLQDDDNHSLIEDTISALCQAIVVNPVDVMCNCYGSHVLRRILCLCKGVTIESSESHNVKSSVALAERLNMRSSQSDAHEKQNQSFPDQLKLLISEMLNPLRTALKLLTGQEQELSRLIPLLLGFRSDKALEENFMEVKAVKKVLRLVEDNAYSHLMEVILAVAPDNLYNEIFTKVFKNSLFRMSSDPSANFVVQALISHARSQEHIELICEELGSKFKNLLELGRSGVVAALVAASQRLHSQEQKCCQALADAVRSTNESSACTVQRLLFLDNYLFTNDKANWSWPNGFKMHVMGSLILQSVFKFPSEYIQAYITSIISLEDNQVLEASKDPSGARVIEAFLSSNAPAKQKRKLVIKLRGHFGELSVLPSGSFTVDKCFNESNMSLRETIVSELLPVQTELSKTKQGPYLLKKLDVEGFARRPEQWKSRQNSKESAYKEFYAAFGPKDNKSSRNENFLSDNYQKSQPEKSKDTSFLSDAYQKSQAEKLKDMRKDIDTRLSGFSHNSGSPFLAHQGSKSKKREMEKFNSYTKNNNEGEIRHNEKKRRRKDGL
ncbi:hypothetical protein BUALT_Bualt18G0046100 [Buddleja alternifolia]|uniref:Uncharacterized protein n=1 Tax=Buddleja alternifolia TaxID=168488 RepID=A0AAV6W866_9LAMI|nr:hypothetical protein BUALT_Bualt18G0046100 [Buddleja alternifolia]